MDSTLILFKFDAIERGLTGLILARFEQAGLRVENCRWLQPTLAHWEQHYDDLKGRNFEAFARSTRYLAGKPVIAVLLTGLNAVAKARAMIGATDPSTAAPGTIRGDFGCDSMAQANSEDRATFNLVHAADSPASAQREIAFWFAPK